MSIKKETFNYLKKNYGQYSSFAIWKDDKHVSDISMFDNDNIVNELTDKYVFVALNPAEHPNNETVKPFVNFHSGYSHQKDFKLCYALHGTKFWGSYITDLFKSIILTDSSKISKKLKESPELVEKDKKALLDELSILGVNKSLIALGRKTEELLRKMLGNQYTIIYIPHYAIYCKKEKYRELVLDKLKSI